MTEQSSSLLRTLDGDEDGDDDSTRDAAAGDSQETILLGGESSSSMDKVYWRKLRRRKRQRAAAKIIGVFGFRKRCEAIWTCRCCNREKAEDWVDFYVGSLRQQGFVLGLALFLMHLFNVIAFYRLQFVPNAYIDLLGDALFGPLISLGVYLVIVVATLATKIRGRNSRLATYTVLALSTLIAFGFLVTSNVLLLRFSRAMEDVGQESSLDMQGDVEQRVNDYSLAMFQACCVLRGWALFEIQSCQSRSACDPRRYNETSCSCFFDGEVFGNGVLEMSTSFCFNLQNAQLDSGINLIGPPDEGILGCGALPATAGITGLPNEFQIEFAAYYKSRLESISVLLLVFTYIWIGLQGIGYGLKFVRYSHRERKLQKRKARQQEIEEKKIRLRHLNLSSLQSKDIALV